MKRQRWTGGTSRRKFIRATESEIEQKLESILEILQIGGAPSGLADTRRGLVQEVQVRDTKRLPRRRSNV
jgi:hypothetical protein